MAASSWATGYAAGRQLTGTSLCAQLLAAGEDVDIILDKTPFYAESGGQIGDHGQLHTVPESSGNGASTAPPAHASVSDVRKMAGDFFLHRTSIQSGRLHVGQQVCAILGWQWYRSWGPWHTCCSA